MIRALLLAVTLTLAGIDLHAQSGRFTINGTVKDSRTGEDLIGAVVYVPAAGSGASSNSYGFYSLSMPRGRYRVIWSFIGYNSHEMEVELDSDMTINVGLDPESTVLEAVEVTVEKPNMNVVNPEMSVAKLSSQAIKSIPALMGEVDVIKAVQLLPGVQASSEGSTGFSVRGGNYDQNLLLLDEATVYNASHLMGFFSLFNNDAIKDLKLYKGDMPAQFGGRLSSLLDIRTKDGNNQKFAATGGIGLITSRLTLEGPVAKDRASFIVSGRRSYFEVFKPFSDELNDKGAYFYDTNMKVNWRINDRDRVFAAAYLGDDKYSMSQMAMGFGNMTGTVRWNHIFTPKLFSNFTLIGSRYKYYATARMSDQLSQGTRSRMEDLGVKADLSYHVNADNTIRFGYNWTHHIFTPSKGGGLDENSVIATDRFDFPKQYAREHAAYLSNETHLDRLILKYGLRYAQFLNLGNGEPQDFLEDYKVAYVKTFRKGETYKTQQSFEPRLGLLFAFDARHSVKAGYTRTAQYIQLASNSSAGSPLDMWFQASQNVKPQLCDQFAAGYFRNFADDMYEMSLEVYYKEMQNVVDFKDHADLFYNEDMEQELRFGRGYAYGFEVLLRKNKGRLNGWFGYSFSRSMKNIDLVNGQRWYRSPYDKPVNVSIVLNYELSEKWSISGNWILASGTPVTYPTGRYYAENHYVPVYSGRNEYRFPTYHRLDLSATRRFTKPGRKYKSELNFSVYNAYGRKNPWMIGFLQEEHAPDVSYAEMVYLFSFVPSITWNFAF